MMFSVKKEKSVRLKSYLVLIMCLIHYMLSPPLFIFSRTFFFPPLVTHQIFSNITLITPLHYKNTFSKYVLPIISFNPNNYLKYTHFYFTYETGTKNLKNLFKLTKLMEELGLKLTFFTFQTSEFSIRPHRPTIFIYKFIYIFFIYKFIYIYFLYIELSLHY